MSLYPCTYPANQFKLLFIPAAAPAHRRQQRTRSGTAATPHRCPRVECVCLLTATNAGATPFHVMRAPQPQPTPLTWEPTRCLRALSAHRSAAPAPRAAAALPRGLRARWLRALPRQPSPLLLRQKRHERVVRGHAAEDRRADVVLEPHVARDQAAEQQHPGERGGRAATATAPPQQRHGRTHATHNPQVCASCCNPSMQLMSG